MKAIIGLLLASVLSSALAAWPIPDNFEVEKTLVERKSDRHISIRENTFIPNIMGYACAWPAINVSRWIVNEVALKHNQNSDFGVTDHGLRLKGPNREFCMQFPTSPQDVFGQEYEVGKEVKVPVSFKREVIVFTDFEGKERRGLLETVETEFLGRTLFSEGFVSLDEVAD